MSALPHALRRILVSLRRVPRSHRHLAVGALPLGLAASGVVPGRPALVLATPLVLAGFGELALDLRSASARRREADRLLAAIDSGCVPEHLRWRAAELTCTRERKALARTLRNLLRSLELPPTLYPTPVNRRALRRNRLAVEALAARLAASDRAVRARGVLLLRHLLEGSPHSPLYDPDAAGELHTALARVRSEIELR